MSVDITFLSSADYARRTGGYVYNTQLVEALQRQGARLRPLLLRTGFPRVSDADRQALRRALDGLRAGSALLTDHIYLCDLQEEFAESGVTVISIFHHSLVVEHGDRGDAQALVLRRAEQAAIDRSAGILATSQETARYLAEHYGAGPDKVAVAVPGNHVVPRAHVATEAGPVSLLSVGAVIPRKRYDYMLDVAGRLADLDWHWSIAGDPDRYPEHLADLRKTADALGLAQRFRFLGDVADADLERLWQASDLFVATSSYEGYGMAVAEAFRHGVPVVTTASGAVATWAASGIVEAPAADAAGMAALIRPLMQQPARLRTLSDRAWAFGQTLPSWETTFAGMAEWIAQRATAAAPNAADHNE